MLREIFLFSCYNVSIRSFSSSGVIASLGSRAFSISSCFVSSKFKSASVNLGNFNFNFAFCASHVDLGLLLTFNAIIYTSRLNRWLCYVVADCFNSNPILLRICPFIQKLRNKFQVMCQEAGHRISAFLSKGSHNAVSIAPLR